MYVITGGTGNIGKPLALALLNAGKKVRIICRNADKAKELIDKGAELFTGDMSDKETANKAFEGAEAVYSMSPPGYTEPDYLAFQTKYGDTIANALEKNKVKYVVALSSIGAHLDKDTGVILGLHRMEERFKKIPGINILFLRPGYFLENTFHNIGIIKNSGIMGSNIKGDTKFAAIATKDIAAYAAKRLLALDISGHNVQYLLGQRDLTYTEITKVLGTAIGKPDLPYVQFSAEDVKKGMVANGSTESVADKMNEFTKALNDGRIMEDAKRDAENTTPTSIEEFSNIFAHVYKMSN